MMRPVQPFKLLSWKNRSTGRLFQTAVLGILLLLFGIIQMPSLSLVRAEPADFSNRNTPPVQVKQPADPTTPAAQTAPIPPPPPAPKLSILLLIDVSGSMNSNNKIDQAKTAAINAINAALKYIVPSGPQTKQPVQKQPIAPVVAGSGIPGIPVKIAQQFSKNLDILDKIQKMLGSDIRKWVSTAEAAEMGKVLKNCEKLMEGLAFEQKSILIKRLSPLVEKMHYSIAARVNMELKAKGLTKGLKYVIPGKTPANPEFGGPFTLNPSDHDAIYFGEGADEAVKLHKQLAKTYGDDFLKMTESCLESSKYTIEKFHKGLRPQVFERFSGPMSNLDWMRSPSGSKWVQEYVDEAGTVVDLDALDDVAKIKPPTEQGSALRKLSSIGDDELRAIGMQMDRSALKDMGFNLGLQSDFERQLALNRARKGLERGFQAAAADDTAMLMSKYGPRYEKVLKGAGVKLDQTSWKGYMEKLEATGKKAKAGAALTAADKKVMAQFDDFARFVRKTSLSQQMQKYASIKQKWSSAFAAGDKAAAKVSQAQITDLLDDTQAALHNYQQLYGKDFVDDMLRNVSQTQDDMASLLSHRLKNSPWVVNERNIGFCVEKELAAKGKLPSPGSTIPKNIVISDSQSLWQYARQNPGHVFAKVAQYGAYIMMSHEILSQIWEGKDYEALKTAGIYAGTEGATHLASYALAAKYGPWAAPGVVLAAAGGFMIGNMAAQWAINSQVDEMSLQMMTGYSNDGTQFYNDKGMLDYLTSARLENVENQNTGQTFRNVEFDSPSEAANLTDEQIMSHFKPGTYGNSQVLVDDKGNVTITEDRGLKLVGYVHGTAMVARDIKVTNISKNQIIAHTRLQQTYQAMRGKYNDALEEGTIQPGSQNVPGDFIYVDPHANFSGSQFTIPNKGGMTMHEFTFYRMMFDRTWSKWSLDKNQHWQDRAYWGSNMENAYKAKWSMFKAFIASMSEGKNKDKEFQERLKSDSPEDLAALKLLAEQGLPFWVNGKKLTPEDIQKMIEKKLEARREMLDKIKNGVIHVQLPQDLENAVRDLSSMVMGDVEIGIMPYSGSCSSSFSLYGFSRDPEGLKDAINGLSAGGGTPMSPALYQARYAICKYGKGQAGTIVLLCDGQNDCTENPVEAADSIRKRTFSSNPGGIAARILRGLENFSLFPPLYAQAQDAPQFIPIDMTQPLPPGRENTPITVSTVGFQVSDREQQVLDEIAQAGGGISGSAQNMAELTQAFTSAIQSAALGVAAERGGVVVKDVSKTNWSLIFVVLLAAASAILLVAILVVRARGTAAPVSGGGALGFIDVTYSSGSTKSVPIAGKKTSLGRSSRNAVVLNDDQVSGRHADIYITQEGMYIVDLESSNGTFVNGQKVDKAWVKPGDNIILGNTNIRIRN